MSDQSASGNRWEPTPGSFAAETGPPPIPPVEQPVAPPAGPRPRVTALRAKVAAATAAIFLVGSAGGFALTNAVSDDDGSSFTPGQGVNADPDDDRDVPGDDRGFGGPNGVPPGQAPDQDGSDDGVDRDTSNSGRADS